MTYFDYSTLMKKVKYSTTANIFTPSIFLSVVVVKRIGRPVDWSNGSKLFASILSESSSLDKEVMVAINF